MSKRVKEILSWYSSDSPGTLANIARLLNHGRLGGTGKLVILPVDQGFEHGPARSFAKNPAGYDPRYHFELAIAAGCNAYAAPLGFLEAGAAEFAGDIPTILKLNNSDSLYSGSDPAPAVTGSVDDALRLGCSAIGFTIYPASSARDTMYAQIRALSEEAKALAWPLVERIKMRFAQGMNDEEEMRELNLEAFKNGVIYGYEDALREDFAREGLDITKIEEWPVERINRVPESLKAKLIPPLKALFRKFRDNLRAAKARG